MYPMVVKGGLLVCEADEGSRTKKTNCQSERGASLGFPLGVHVMGSWYSGPPKTAPKPSGFGTPQSRLYL